MKYDICGIGNAIVDISINLSDQQFKDLGLDRGRMYLTSPEEQATLRAKLEDSNTTVCSGGSAANSIIAASGQGAKCAYVCSVADDIYGNRYIEDIEEQGADFKGIKNSDGETGSSIILITPDAERTMNTHLGVSVKLDYDGIDHSIIGDSTWVYIEGYLFSAHNGHELVKKAIEAAKAQGSKVALTLSDVFIVETHREFIDSIASDIDLVFANIDEAISYLGLTSENIYEKMASKFKNVAITYGKDGAKVKYDGQEIVSQAREVVAVDMTGAGDMFAGTLLAGIASNADLQKATDKACLLASKLVVCSGARLTKDQMSEEC